MLEYIQGIIVSITALFMVVVSPIYTPPQPTPTPEPEIVVTEPSEKALKIASFLLVRMPEEIKKELKQKYGDENMSNTEFLRQWALKMDLDPVLIAQNEALMQKFMAQEGQPIQNSFYEQQTGTTTDTFEQDRQRRRLEEQQECQKETAEYNTCLSEYSIKFGEYNNCLMEGEPWCSKPTKFCHKPYCPGL